MSPERFFSLIYAPLFKDHLRTIDAKYYSMIRQELESQLSFDPDIETRNRKPLKRPGIFESSWEIRFGPENRFRVFYKVDRANAEVHVLAIGEKRGNRIFIGGQEVE